MGDTMKRNDIRRILFVTDLHGSDIVFKKMLSLGKSLKVDLIIMGGDIAGKLLIPIVESSGEYKLNYNGQIITLKSQKDLENWKIKISNEGNYSKIVSYEEFQKLKDDESLKNQYFQLAAEERVKEWINLADNYLKDTGIKILISGGNDDTQNLIDTIKNSETIVNVDQKVYNEYEPFNIVNIGFSNPTPFLTPREVSEEDLEKMIENLLSGLNINQEHLIFNIHVPPYNTSLDLAPKLIVKENGSLSIELKGGEPEMVHVGSRAVRKMIEKYQPSLSLHGHIHEARAVEKIGKTICINPGSSYTEGTLNSALINIRESKIIGYQLLIS